MPKVGGKRIGAGRPKGSPNAETISKAQAREALRVIVLEHMRAMVDSQVAHAKGLKYLVKRHKQTGKFEKVTEKELDNLLDGEESDRVTLEVWEKDPSVQAFTDLMNRALDKPSDHVELTGADGTPLVVKWEG